MSSEESGIARNLWDTVSMLPVDVLSFILDKLLPGCYIEGEYANMVHSRQRQLDMSDKSHYFILMGSIMDGLPIISTTEDGIANSADHDMWKVMEAFTVGFSYDSQAPLLADAAECMPAYTRLRFNENLSTNQQFDGLQEYVGIYSDGPGYMYLSSEKIKYDYLQLMLKTKMDGESDVLIHGPALSSSCKGFDQDLVMVILSHEWPPIAKAWITRPRPSSWPSQKMIEEISQSGCEIVPVGHPTSSTKHLEWRISFTRAEQKLCRSFNTTQKQCYLVLKAILKTQLSTLKAYTGYMLKTMMFWTLEEMPAEQLVHENALGIYILRVLDGLITGFINHFIPEYFMPARNLIGHIHPSFIRSILNILTDIRRHPIHYALVARSQKIFSMSVPSHVSVPLSELLSPILSINFSTFYCRREIHLAKQKISGTLFLEYMASNYMPGAYKNFLYFEGICSNGFWDSYSESCSSEEKFTLARLYSYMYDKVPKDYVVRKAELLFSQALVDISAELKPKLKCEYMLFLCKLPHGNEKALQIASEIVESFDLKMTLQNEHATLFATDVGLQDFVGMFDFKTLIVSTRAVALYCCVKLNAADKFYLKANIYVDELMQYALTLDMTGYDKIHGNCRTFIMGDTYVLLGFALLWVKDYYSAFKVFDRISQIMDRSTDAQRQITKDFGAICLFLAVLQQLDRISRQHMSIKRSFECALRRKKLDKLPYV